MMYWNGAFLDESPLANNRGLYYGDAVFETLKIANGKILHWEDHYFRLMATMRIVRMRIPMTFTMEFLEESVLKLTQQLSYNNARVRVTIIRKSGGYYKPTDNNIDWLITAEPLHSERYNEMKSSCEVELYKDFHLPKHLLSTLKTNNKQISVLASIYAEENGYDNMLLINEDKNIVETTNGNLFVVQGNTIITPPLSDGCLNGIVRKNLIPLISKTSNIVEQRSISPFELQQSDELFYTNSIQGIQSITKYRKKEYSNKIGNELYELLNASIS